MINIITSGADADYQKYLDNHIKNVKRVYNEIVVPNIDLFELTNAEKEQLEDNICKHDNSKWIEPEWIGYRQWFYPESEDDKDRNKFDVACLHHYHNNPHHWNHWILNDDEDASLNKILSMPKIYVIEMLCDWGSFKYGDDPDSTAYKWWNSNNHKMAMTNDTRNLIEKYIELFK